MDPKDFYISDSPGSQSESKFVAADEPIECPLCGLDPISALAAGIRPAVLTHPGWIQCDCRGDKPYNVREELLRRSERTEDSRMCGDIRACFYEDVHRPHEPGSSSSGSNRSKDKFRNVARAEQDWQGFPGADHASTERLENLVVPIKGTLPAYLRQRWKQEARTTESRLLRWLISRHLKDVSAVPKLRRGPENKVAFRFLVTPTHAEIWRAKKAQLGCSNSELLAAICVEEWT